MAAEIPQRGSRPRPGPLPKGSRTSRRLKHDAKIRPPPGNMRLLTNQLWAVDAIGSEQRDQPPNVRCSCAQDRIQNSSLVPICTWRVAKMAFGEPKSSRRAPLLLFCTPE